MDDNTAPPTSSSHGAASLSGLSAMDGRLQEAAATGDSVTMRHLATHDPGVLLGTTPPLFGESWGELLGCSNTTTTT